MASNKKGVILFIVLATVLIVVILAGVILSLISSQSRLTNHQVSRIKAYYAAKGIMNYVLEKLRVGDGGWVPPASAGGRIFACHGGSGGCIDNCAPVLEIPYDEDLPDKIQVTIYGKNAALNNTVTRIDIKVQYTYTP